MLNESTQLTHIKSKEDRLLILKDDAKALQIWNEEFCILDLAK